MPLPRFEASVCWKIFVVAGALALDVQVLSDRQRAIGEAVAACRKHDRVGRAAVRGQRVLEQDELAQRAGPAGAVAASGHAAVELSPGLAYAEACA
jgi:hypothetical protein